MMSFSSFSTALQAVFLEQGGHITRLTDRANKWDHDLYIGEGPSHCEPFLERRTPA